MSWISAFDYGSCDIVLSNANGNMAFGTVAKGESSARTGDTDGYDYLVSVDDNGLVSVTSSGLFSPGSVQYLQVWPNYGFTTPPIRVRGITLATTADLAFCYAAINSTPNSSVAFTQLSPVQPDPCELTFLTAERFYLGVSQAARNDMGPGTLALSFYPELDIDPVTIVKFSPEIDNTAPSLPPLQSIQQQHTHIAYLFNDNTMDCYVRDDRGPMDCTGYTLQAHIRPYNRPQPTLTDYGPGYPGTYAAWHTVIDAQQVAIGHVQFVIDAATIRSRLGAGLFRFDIAATNPYTNGKTSIYHALLTIQ